MSPLWPSSVLNVPWPRQVAARQSADKSAHSKSALAIEISQSPLGNRRLQFFQLIIKEVPCAFDDAELNRRLDLRNQFSQTLNVAILIHVALHKKNWLATLLEKTEVVVVDRRADAD